MFSYDINNCDGEVAEALRVTCDRRKQIKKEDDENWNFANVVMVLPNTQPPVKISIFPAIPTRPRK